MDPISRILASTTDILLDALKPGKGDLKLKENQIVQATVMKILPEGKAQLDIDGMTLEARTRMPLSENDTLFLKVTRDEGATVLKLVESYSKPGVPDGLSEMRSLGREGPYTGLAKIVNPSVDVKADGPMVTGKQPAPLIHPAPEGGPGLEGGEARPVSLPTGKDASEPKLPFGTVKLPFRTNAPPVSETTGSPQGPPPNIPPSTSRDTFIPFLADRKIPFETKLTLLVSSLSSEKNPVPDAVLRPLAEKLVKIHGSQDMTVPVKQDRSGSPAEPVGVMLKRVMADTLKTLDPQAAGIASKAVQTPSMTTGEKILALLENQGPKILDKTDLEPLREYLARTAETGRPDEKTLMDSVTSKPSIADHRISDSVSRGITDTVNRDMPDTAGVVRKIRDLFEAISLKPQALFDGDSLKKAVHDSGLMWENKIKTFMESIGDKGRAAIQDVAARLVEGDVKALAMKGADQPDAVSPKELETLKTFVDSLEKMQILNQHTSEDAGRYLLPLPFFSGENLKFGQLFVDLDKKKSQDKAVSDRVIRVAFILELSSLGHIQADVAVYKKSLSGEFLVENSAVKDLLDGAIPELKAELAKKGYILKKMDSRVEERSVLSRVSLTERLVDLKSGSLSIMI